jgi:hypothetical protein
MPKYLITVRTIVEDRQTIEVDAPGRRQAIALAKRAAPRWHPTFLGVALGRGQHVKRVHGETRTILHVLSVMGGHTGSRGALAWPLHPW